MSEYAILGMMLVGAVAFIVTAIRGKHWLLLVAGLGLLMGILMRAAWL